MTKQQHLQATTTLAEIKVRLTCLETYLNSLKSFNHDDKSTVDYLQNADGQLCCAQIRLDAWEPNNK